MVEGKGKKCATVALAVLLGCANGMGMELVQGAKSSLRNQEELEFNRVLQSLDVPAIAPVDGWASVYGVTGGGNASPTVVTNLAQFRSAVENDNPKVVVVQGTIAIGSGDRVRLGSHTTLVGSGTNARITTGRVEVNGEQNVIIQNIEFSGSADDNVEILNSQGVFVTQCTVHDAQDELLTMKRGTDFVTLSNNHFYFDVTHGHAYAHLIGHSDNNAGQDRGHLKVTLHDNFYGKGIRSRQPRVRFGQVHVYNTLYMSDETDYVIGLGDEAQIRVENIYVDGQDDVFQDMGGVDTGGRLGWRNVFNHGSDVSAIVSNTFPVFDVPYSFELKGESAVLSTVQRCAGSGSFKVSGCF